MPYNCSFPDRVERGKVVENIVRDADILETYLGERLRCPELLHTLISDFRPFDCQFGEVGQFGDVIHPFVGGVRIGDCDGLNFLQPLQFR